MSWALAEEKGVQYAKEASGHKSDRYIWRYLKPSQQSLAAAIYELEVKDEVVSGKPSTCTLPS